MTRENRIDLVTPEEATGKTAEIYDEIASAREGDLDDELALSKLWMTFGNDPDLLEVMWERTDLMYNRGDLPFELKSKISLVVASVMSCEGCRFFHESALEREGTDEDAIEQLKHLDLEESSFSRREYEVLRFAEKATEDPNSVTDEDLRALRELGFAGKELLEVLDCIAFHVYTATLQAMSGIVYEGMSREEWATLDEERGPEASAETAEDEKAEGADEVSVSEEVEERTATTVELFKTEDCGRCPQVLATLEDVAEDRDVELRVTDVEADRQRALDRGVLSVPTVVVEGGEMLRGVPTEDELLRAIDARGA